MSTASIDTLVDRFGVDDVRIEETRPNYNITPRSSVPIVAETSEHRRVLDKVRWGLVPSWAKDTSIGDRLINARAESVDEKPAYRKAFQQRRCLIAADGFYEWQARPDQKRKQPFFITRPDRRPFAFAGIYEVWRDKEDPEAPRLRSCAIITTDANARLRPVHDRMPVVLHAEAWEQWLDPSNHDVAALKQMLVAVEDDYLEAYPVSTAVNKPGNNSPELLERVVPEGGDPDASA